MPRVLGVMGLPGSGKTEAACLLAGWGATRIDVDALGHEALERPELRDELRAALGPETIPAAGPVDRSRVAVRVFADAGALAALERVLHPRMAARAREEIARLGENATAVLDAALLVPMGLDRDCDAVLVLEAPEALRAGRLRARGWTREELQRRQERLQRIEAPGGAVVIVNDGAIETLNQRLRTWWNGWIKGERNGG